MKNIMGWLLGVYWILFGLWTTSMEWWWWGALIAGILVSRSLLTKKDISISPASWLFLGLNLLLFASSLWSSDWQQTLKFGLLSLSGFLWLFMGENWSQDKRINVLVKQSILSSSGLLILLLGLSLLFNWGIAHFGPDSLVTWGSYYKNHNHLGDWLILAALMLIHKKDWRWLLFLPLIIMARSRSAILGLMVGWGYLVFNSHENGKWKKWPFICLIFGLVFVATSMNKTTLGSRDFFVQAIASLTHNPWGVGYGQFSTISTNPDYHLFGLKSFSVYAHSIVFEWLGGIGWLGLVGVIWLALSAYKIGKRTDEDDKTLSRAMWWSMLVPMLLDTVYIIPSYWWLWMVMTGLAM